MSGFIMIDVRGRRIESLTLGRLQIDAPRWLATWDGVKVKLPRAPMLLVYHLACRPGLIRSRDALFAAIVTKATANPNRTIDSCVKRARRAFEEVDPNFNQIDAVYTIGYRWRLE
ncbi:winged helix-turn-helix domain-containing protein [Neotabrizicola sp. sgz301269]|uniref:winged helix-turn-helix domain-containing protein n=1 Tax=Neotabrizicola sp. sgz301269 TaxID=3276282 RepID=UPI00377002D1